MRRRASSAGLRGLEVRAGLVATSRCCCAAAASSRRWWRRSLERGLLRFFYGRDEVLLVLVTYALFLILEDVTKLIWGVNPYYVSEPYGLFGNVCGRACSLRRLRLRAGRRWRWSSASRSGSGSTAPSAARSCWR